MSYYDDYEGYESPDEEWDRLQKELQDEIVDRIENTISKKDWEEGPICYDAFTGAPIYRHGGYYPPTEEE